MDTSRTIKGTSWSSEGRIFLCDVAMFKNNSLVTGRVKFHQSL